VTWETEQSFDGKSCREYSYQILSKSDNCFSSHSEKCRGCFFEIQCTYRDGLPVRTPIQVLTTWQQPDQASKPQLRKISQIKHPTVTVIKPSSTSSSSSGSSSCAKLLAVIVVVVVVVPGIRRCGPAANLSQRRPGVQC